MNFRRYNIQLEKSNMEKEDREISENSGLCLKLLKR